MEKQILPYELPEDVRQSVLTLAAESDLLLIGESHGTQEVPCLVLGLLPYLMPLGFGGLALELPTDQCDQLLQYIQGKAALPGFFHVGLSDGRGNEQVLSLVRQAVSRGWHLLCFDTVNVKPGDIWSDRDTGMVQNLLEQWGRQCSGQRVLGVCGSLHSRLLPPTRNTDAWPSFAYGVQQARPNLIVRSIGVLFQRGAFFSGEVRRFDIGPEYFSVQPEVRPSGFLDHTVDLYLPRATPVTFTGSS